MCDKLPSTTLLDDLMDQFEEITTLFETWNDQDTLDMFNHQENTVSSSSEPCNNSEMNRSPFSSSSDENNDDTLPSSTTAVKKMPIKRPASNVSRRKNVKRPRGGATAQRIIVTNNPTLSEAVQCQSVDEMIRMACLHRYNVDNLEMLEWSEAVLLQLCHLEKELDMKLLDWSYAKRILENQWCYEIVIPLQQYIGCRETLSHIIMKNRAHKMKSGLLESRDRIFSSPPTINYDLLRTYVTAPMINMYRENLFRKKIDL